MENNYNIIKFEDILKSNNINIEKYIPVDEITKKKHIFLNFIILDVELLKDVKNDDFIMNKIRTDFHNIDDNNIPIDEKIIKHHSYIFDEDLEKELYSNENGVNSRKRIYEALFNIDFLNKEEEESEQIKDAILFKSVCEIYYNDMNSGLYNYLIKLEKSIKKEKNKELYKLYNKLYNLIKTHIYMIDHLNNSTVVSKYDMLFILITIMSCVDMHIYMINHYIEFINKLKEIKNS